MEPLIRSLSPILIVNDLTKTIAFYKENLSFDVERTETNFASLRTGDTKFMFMAVKCLDDHPDRSFVEQVLTTKLGVGVDLYLEVDDVSHLYESLKSKGVKILYELHTMPWGAREFSIEDPDGYKLTFGQNDNAASAQSNNP